MENFASDKNPRREKFRVFHAKSGFIYHGTYEFKWRFLSLLLSRQNHPPSRGYIFEMVNRCTAISKGVVARVCALRGDCLRPLKLLLCLLYSRSPSLDSRFRTDDDWFSSSNILPTLLLPFPSLFFVGSILICCRWTQRLYVQT